MSFLPEIPQPLAERGSAALQWEALREKIAAAARSPLGHAWVQALEPSANLAWIEEQGSRVAALRRLVASAASFDFRGIFDCTDLLDQARIEGAALEATDLLAILGHAERVEAWRQLVLAPPDTVRPLWAAITKLSAPLLHHDLGNLLRALRGKIEPDGTLSDDASPELARIRRAQHRQHRAIQESLRRALSKLSDDGSTQGDLITVRGERFVIPIKAELKRKVAGVIHGSSSSGQTVFVEPMETIEQNNELARLLDEEQAEIHRILVAMTRAVAVSADGLLIGASVLAEADAHQAVARFAQDLDCVQPTFETQDDSTPSNEPSDNEFDLAEARHPLLELRLRELGQRIVPLHFTLPKGKRQMIISGPNTGGKTVALKTAGLLAIMAQTGLPVTAKRAHLPLFTAIYADIGDAQSIEQNLSTFSAHIVNVERIAHDANSSSLVLLDELGSATDPEEGAALAVAIAEHFLRNQTWSIITTHLTALKIYGAEHDGVLNAAVGFDEETLSPTYDLRLGVPGASAGLNIAARLGLDPRIVTRARAQLSTQQIDIGRFLDDLHAQLTAATQDRAHLAASQRQLDLERQRLQDEGRKEQQARTRELERQLSELISDFERQLRDTVKAIDDKTVAQKIARDSALRIARLRREFSEQFQSTVAAHTDQPTTPNQLQQKRTPRPGDTVRLKSLNREADVIRLLAGDMLEVTMGAMKMRVPATDVAEITGPTPTQTSTKRRSGGVTFPGSGSSDDYAPVSAEINVIGRTADEAEAEVDRFVEHAYLAGLPRIRVVHGVGMGILRRTLREFLRQHPHVTGVTEPPHNEGGQGATIVDLRQ
jgi:DNA mismatch repair protein MutS2